MNSLLCMSQIVVLLLGLFIALACVLQGLGGLIRSSGCGRLGKGYWYLVAPGVVCHETGHAAGCLLTFSRIVKFVPFHPSGDTLGYVQHETRPGLWGMVANAVISTGPIWFGCAVICLLTWALLDVKTVANFGDYLPPDRMPGLWAYVCACFSAAFDIVKSLFSWLFSSGWKGWVWFYLVFCVASEIGLSSVDITHMWKGLALILVVVLGLSCIPPVGNLMLVGVQAILPQIFLMHALMAFAVLVDFLMLVVVRILARF